MKTLGLLAGLLLALAGTALIFAGPDGSNKLNFALTFAKVLSCQEGRETACNRCRSRRRCWSA